ncbi:16S rRNA (cytosine(967)-C(5))-methyltransferase RsmB [Parageobacillus thermoglucosidasius]|uniref:16S rRNA (cytosine(967)-C(5))-methyltransferase n=1 Tax=Parageobacillus thermoglucosidasius TaxID=1426 RepID=A0AAN0YPJ3_PARTM|nr:16S rRNA (cytosine(967)-C(5))-methyltransferase RsmB [Parageobacillus thermoglucosidasius]REK54994.1 MAG: 16S rRNA (cytosine(967)-C(5))-methyltransferase RsmB [Geobacillus sp.]ALF10107.1 16S rRNA methyltransferase [Parageobacillus thermoglucosidasius]ANZ30189.1 16S rRNA (cytosine(967)-C(5))-methyltransferase [Parageobacillus thermoglucosidasius]APM80926.1 16S rRNA (cytosine(967)-C(5))-methyltransferase [Parageobacillus thermoglucosidasius]KJX70642.1 16S rRNA methyltransferase [Parageobacill
MKAKNVREVALETLLAVEEKEAYSNLLLNNMIETHRLSERDVRLLTEIVYGTIQRRDTLDYYLAPFLKKARKLERWVRVLLRLTLYQVLYLDRIPDRAAIFEAVEIAKKRGHQGIASLVNGVMRAILRQGVPPLENIEDEVERLAVATSHPRWLVKRWVEQYGWMETKRMCETNLLPPKQTARVNTARITIAETLDRLRQEGMEVSRGEVAAEAIQAKKGNLANTEAFRRGWITIQDESSMLVARALGPKEHERVLDSCAAPGGKSTHIAELMNNTGQVICADIHEHKVNLIEENAKRLQLTNISARTLDSRRLGEVFERETFDKILVDAPCSGFGVIRRKPDIKYAKTEADISSLAALQREILDAVAPLLKKGGTLVYSTCTIDHEENEAVIAQFLNDHPEFSPDETMQQRLPEKVQPYVRNGQLHLLPHYFGSDGFFIASLRKKV